MYNPRDTSKLFEGYVMVVYAYKMLKLGKCSDPWIYGVYQDHREGFAVMKQMKESDEYGHLTWLNILLKLK